MAGSEASGRSSQLLALLLSGVAGLALALVTLFAWGGDGPPATVSGVVAGVPPSSQVLIVATRNDCVDPDRNPVELGRTLRRGPGAFVVDVPAVGPGVGWVCAYELAGAGQDVARYAQAWMPRRPVPQDTGRLEFPPLELQLAAGPALPAPDRSSEGRPHGAPEGR